MLAAIEWAWANPAYALGGLFGLCVGVFYGFDGWRGDTADVEFKDSPRMKNLLWVVGGGFTTLIGDVKALDATASRGLVLLAYFALWLAAAALVVIFWGIVVWISRLLASRRDRDYGYSAGDAVSDYYFYGYRHYQAKLDAARHEAAEAVARATELATQRAEADRAAAAAEEARQRAEAERAAAAAAEANQRAEAARDDQTTRFHNAYVGQLALAIGAIGPVDDGNRLAIARSILIAIAAVIKSYHRDDSDSKGIRANVMLKKDCNEDLRKRMKFVDAAARAEVARCLELVTYDIAEDPPGIVLPVSDDPNTVLPGAPAALLNRVAVIDDTLEIKYAQGVPQPIRDEIDTYFRQKTFRSFGSIQINGANGVLGVVNLEATVPSVFGQNDEERRQVVRYLLPLCAALAIVFPHS